MFDADDNIITFFYHVFDKICELNVENIKTLCCCEILCIYWLIWWDNWHYSDMISRVFIINLDTGTWDCYVFVDNIDERDIDIGIHGKCVTADIAIDSAEQILVEVFF